MPTNEPQPTVEFIPTHSANPDEATVALPRGASSAAPEADGNLPRIPGYQIIGEIARGGMGCVLAGTELTLDREVAVKVLLPGANPDRFISESKITAKLPHPNIPPIYSLGTLEDGSPYLAMKFVRGQTLAAELKARPHPLHELPRFVQVFEQICQAVGFAHALHIIHRDLKPANIMLGAFGEVQVMDWGLAKELKAQENANLVTDSLSNENGETADLTRAGSVMGTPAYMAPEQARGESVDPRADVFALGGILCNMLTGRAVHTGISASDTIQKAATGQLAETLARLDACGADAELVSIARQCLAFERVNRPADGQVVARMIAAYRQGVEARLHQAESDRAAALVREAEQQKRRRQFFRLAGVVAAVLILGIVGTTVGMVRATEAAESERIAKNKAEGRLKLIRSTINQFTNDLPNIGSNLPLSEGLRRELLKRSKKLITSISDQNDLNDTYDFGIHALALREVEDLIAKEDYTTAKQKTISALEGFQKILDGKPELIDRSRNNVAIALTDLGRIETNQLQYENAEKHFELGLALRREIVAQPNGDMSGSDRQTALAYTLTQYGWLEVLLKRYDSARTRFQEAQSLYEKNLQTGGENIDYESARSGWCLSLASLASLEEWLAREAKDKAEVLEHRQKVIQYYETVIEQLQEDIKANPAAVGMRASLALHASRLARFYQDSQSVHSKSILYFDLAVRTRRTLWETPEITDLADTIGSNYYQLGTLKERENQPEAARKYFERCLPFWTLCCHDAEEKGLPADSEKLIARKIVLMLVQGRLRMHTETGRAAAELQSLSRRIPELDRKRDYSVQSTVGYSYCAVAFPAGSMERVDYFKKAMTTLRLAVDLGWRNWEYLETDEDFDAMREWPEFQKAIDEWKLKYPVKK